MNTPGPWHRNIKPASRYPVVFAGRNTHVAQVKSQGLTDEEVEANCDLIAAAPELLAVVERLITEGVSLGLYEQARAAFDKARGDY